MAKYCKNMNTASSLEREVHPKKLQFSHYPSHLHADENVGGRLEVHGAFLVSILLNY